MPYLLSRNVHRCPLRSGVFLCNMLRWVLKIPGVIPGNRPGFLYILNNF
nr:MAG TPA: hypothetical protein [Caudoviricetes sp.]